MTKKEYCTTHDVKAVYSTGLSGISIHGFEWGIEDYVYWSESHEVILIVQNPIWEDYETTVSTKETVVFLFNFVRISFETAWFL